MATILDARVVCDGYDIRILTNGQAQTLHFATKPNAGELGAAIAALEEAANITYVILGEEDA